MSAPIVITTADTSITADTAMAEIELSMSNCDHSVDEGLADALKAGGVFARHAGWNFNGRVWWSDGKFHEQVWTYHVPREIISADTLEELMKAVKSKRDWSAVIIHSGTDAEFAKLLAGTELVCANCHRIEHDNGLPYGR